jgi:hypothetical protein
MDLMVFGPNRDTPKRLWQSEQKQDLQCFNLPSRKNRFIGPNYRPKEANKYHPSTNFKFEVKVFHARSF